MVSALCVELYQHPITHTSISLFGVGCTGFGVCHLILDCVHTSPVSGAWSDRLADGVYQGHSLPPMVVSGYRQCKGTNVPFCSLEYCLTLLQTTHNRATMYFLIHYDIVILNSKILAPDSNMQQRCKFISNTLELCLFCICGFCWQQSLPMMVLWHRNNCCIIGHLWRESTGLLNQVSSCSDSRYSSIVWHHSNENLSLADVIMSEALFKHWLIAQLWGSYLWI